MTTRSQEPTPRATSFERGQRLYCESCQSEVEVINPCPDRASGMTLRCCGEPMRPTTGVSVHLNDSG